MPVYATTPEQRHRLLTDGFVLLPDAIAPDDLTRWRQLANRLERRALDAWLNHEPLPGVCIGDDPGGPHLMRYNGLLAVEGEAVLDLLSAPAMMAVAREFCGRGVVPWQCDLLYKQPHPSPATHWHQDAPHSRTAPYLNVGIYLDDADANDGCLRYVPGTQHELQKICELSEKYGWEIPGAVERPAKAGDILVQDMMVLHGSPPKRTAGPRRTIYVEFGPAATMTAGRTELSRWRELRRRWMGLVVRHADPSDWPVEWNVDLPTDLGPEAEEIAAIAAVEVPPIPANYCYRSVETPEYPVPSDLQDGMLHD